MSLLLGLSFFLIALCATAIFSYLETAVTAIRFFKIRELSQSIPRYQNILTVLEQAPHRILITTLIACNLANVTAAALSTQLMTNLFAHWHLSAGLGLSAGIALATVCLLIFGEILPKNFAKMHGEEFLGSTLWMINLSYYALFPIVKVLTMLSNQLLGTKEQNTELITSEKEIKFLIEYINQKQLMEPDKSLMLQNIFRICNTPVSDILVPEPDMVIIDAKKTLHEALSLFVTHQYSRFPVYEDKNDNIVGILYQKDIFKLLQQGEGERNVKEVMRPVLFVPETTKANRMLKDFRDKHVHMAVVLDEHGAIAGLVTLEDVLEEIVGEIKDEHEVDTSTIVLLGDGQWLVSGNTNLHVIANMLHITFQTEHALTIAGFLSEYLQRVPQKSERVEYSDFVFQVQKASPRRVLQVLIFKK